MRGRARVARCHRGDHVASRAASGRRARRFPTSRRRYRKSTTPSARGSARLAQPAVARNASVSRSTILQMQSGLVGDPMEERPRCLVARATRLGGNEAGACDVGAPASCRGHIFRARDRPRHRVARKHARLSDAFAKANDAAEAVDHTEVTRLAARLRLPRDQQAAIVRAEIERGVDRALPRPVFCVSRPAASRDAGRCAAKAGRLGQRSNRFPNRRTMCQPRSDPSP